MYSVLRLAYKFGKNVELLIINVIDVAFLAGEYIGILHLPFRPSDQSAVACSQTSIFVTEYQSATIHEVSWEGKELGLLTQTQLQLREDEWVLATRCVHEGAVLVYAAGDNWEVTSLSAFKVRHHLQKNRIKVYKFFYRYSDTMSDTISLANQIQG